MKEKITIYTVHLCIKPHSKKKFLFIDEKPRVSVDKPGSKKEK